MAKAFDFTRIVKHNPWQLLTLQIFACLIAKHVLGFEEVGAVEPKESYIKTGGSGNITCRMKSSRFEGKNSSCLNFTPQNASKVLQGQIHIIDNTSIVWMINNAMPGIYHSTCMCHDRGVDNAKVYVGTPPVNITDFSCQSYDFNNITCRFTRPPNFILTEYKLSFTTATENYSNECNLTKVGNQSICVINADYKLIYRYYNFTLIPHNPLGNLTQHIQIDQYSIMIPAKPKVDIADTTTNGVVLYITNLFKMFQYMEYTSGLNYQVRLRPEKFDWIEHNYSKRNKTPSFEIRINNLKYAYRRYELIVRVRTGIAVNNETMWSEPFENEFVTKPKRPDNPPAVDIGSFYIDPAGHTLRLYWKQLPEYEENGPQFKYIVTDVRQDGYLVSNVQWIDSDNTSATLKWNSSSRYEFKIKSQNKEGQSIESSVINVSGRPDYFKSEGKQHINKVYHNQTYTISWAPEYYTDLVDFTLFWCKSKMESQNQCMGTIDFMHFDSNTYNHTTKAQHHALNFAVSVNYKTYSTGMIWATCTADLSTDLIKMYPEITPLSSTSIKIKWGTECPYAGILERYNLIYCVVDINATESSGDCKGPEQKITINKTAKEHTLKNLEPFAKYKIFISMSSKVKDGPVSDPLFAMTTEDAPSPPYDLKSYNVTSKSAVISWLPPKKTNGNLRSYTVWVNNEQHNISAVSDTEGPITYTLQHLRSFTPYKVYVTAHTVKKSHESNDIHLKTKIGFPSSPQSVKLTKRNNGLVLNWNRPDVPSGRVEFYEIRINITRNNKTDECKISGIRGQSYDLKLPPCSEPNYAYTFEVRAVNLAKCNEIDYEIKPDASISCARHQGGPRRRRHSKINSSIDSTYHISNEQLKPTKGSTTKLIDAVESPMIPCVNDNNICKDLIFTNNMSTCMSILLEPFYSEWGTSAYYTCGEAQMSKLPFIAISVIFIVLILFAMGYFANKKVEKMRSIGMELPEGLNETTSTTKGITPCEDIMRSEELLYDKENHRLLSQIGNDSGFLNSGQCLDENSVHVCSDHHDSEKSSQSTDSVELTEINSCSYTSSPSQSPKANIHETVPREEENVVQPVIQATPIQLRPTDNGYIKPMMLTNGYVQAQAFQKPRENPSFNGYTKLDDRGKPIFHPLVATGNIGLANPKVSSSKDIEAPQPMNGNICGYVTHKQLSDFGQHLQ